MIPNGITEGIVSAWGVSIKVLATLFFVLFVISIITASSSRTEGMRGNVEYWVTETEVIIDSLEAAGETEEIVSCYRTILNCYRVVIGQLDAVDMLREYGPPE